MGQALKCGGHLAAIKILTPSFQNCSKNIQSEPEDPRSKTESIALSWSARATVEPRKDVVSIKPEKIPLLRPDLMNIDVVESSVYKPLDRSQMVLGLWTECHTLSDGLWPYQLDRLVEMRGKRQVGHQVAADSSIRPVLSHYFGGPLFRRCVTDGHLPIARFSTTS